MTNNPDKPGPGDLEAPFLFVPHGSPEPTEWMRRHPGWVKFPATFVPHAPVAQRMIPSTNRPWPVDKRGQPWPASRFGQPLRPLDEYPPGMRAPGEGYTGPAADPDMGVRAYLASRGVWDDPAVAASGTDPLVKAYLDRKEFWESPGKYAVSTDDLVRAYLDSRRVEQSAVGHADDPRPELVPAQFVPLMLPPPAAQALAPPLSLPPPPSRTKPSGQRGTSRYTAPYSTPQDSIEALIPPPPIPPVHDTIAPPPSEPEMFPSDEGAHQPPFVTPPAPQLPIIEELIPPVLDPATVFERNAPRDDMERAGKITPGKHAHHIVPGGNGQAGGRDPTLAQRRLRELDVGLNSEKNGVALSPEFHRYVHTRGYYDYVNSQLLRAETKQDAEERLDHIRQLLKRADQTYHQDGSLPSWKAVR